MSVKKRGRGRPVKYKGTQLKHMLSLVRQHGVSGAEAILKADVKIKAEDFEGGTPAECKAAAADERALAKMRDLKIVPHPLTISKPTLGKRAKEAGIVLTRGRRPLKKAA